MQIIPKLKWILCLALINPINVYAIFTLYNGDIMLWGGGENYQFHWSLKSMVSVFFPPTIIFILSLFVVNAFDKKDYSCWRASCHYVVSIIVASILIVIVSSAMLLL
ncbi:hypothetical protein [Photobacterium sanguinicancri]|uniref:Uncharacterized protein n=1 Tax=Photobacterium sanguinicancri TaxID=875932 RepID=A0AAW7Y0M4_9GAMM|nr:hypothetical protein [Photobacterium sanguinicancri]MDO6541917.1 hypothetical protein [Photobacterium sanguinicancri]